MLEKHTVCGWAVLGEIGQQGESKVQNIHFQFHCSLPKACLAVQYRDATFRCSLIHSGLPQHVITFFFNLHLRCSVQQFYTKKSFFVIKLKNSCILFSTKSHFNAQQLEGNQLWITDKRKKHPKHQIFASIWPAVFRVVFGYVFSISCRGSLSLNRSRLADKTATRFLKRDCYAEVASVGAADASAHRCQRTPWQNRATSQPSD